ncbi:MAG: DUF5906 domain-containing protein [Nitrososphaeraceae archaeon]
MVACSCPAIMRFMHEVMAPEDVETVLDFIAYCLWRGFPFHRYLLFNGSGRNGKGVMLEIIKCFLGHNNVSGESLHRLLDTRFATAELYGKLANIDADLSKAALKNTGVQEVIIYLQRGFFHLSNLLIILSYFFLQMRSQKQRMKLMLFFTSNYNQFSEAVPRK